MTKGGFRLKKKIEENFSKDEIWGKKIRLIKCKEVSSTWGMITGTEMSHTLGIAPLIISIWLGKVPVMAQTMEKERIKVNKKFSVGLVMAMVLMVATFTAMAAELNWQQYASTIKQMEHEQGSYASWPVEDRVNLVQALIEMGYLNESEDTAKLFAVGTPAEEQQAIADKLLLQLTRKTDITEISLDSMTYAVLGYPDFWTPEQRVWWEEITYMFIPEEEREEPDRLVLPDDSVISEAEAIEIAKAAIIEAYELSENALDHFQPVADLYITTQRPDYRRWLVEFHRYREGTIHVIEKTYFAVIDEEGNIITDPDMGYGDIKVYAAYFKVAVPEIITEEGEVYNKYAEQVNGDPFWTWPYDLKAAYSKEVWPLVKDKDAVNEAVAFSTTYLYGMPTENDLPYEEALKLAQQALQDQFDMDQSTVSMYSQRFEAYDVTDSDKPLWKFTLINPDDYYGIWYRVEIAAATGEITRVEQGHWQERDWANQEFDYMWLF